MCDYDYEPRGYQKQIHPYQDQRHKWKIRREGDPKGIEYVYYTCIAKKCKYQGEEFKTEINHPYNNYLNSQFVKTMTQISVLDEFGKAPSGKTVRFVRS